jgi:hypothetical protein
LREDEGLYYTLKVSENGDWKIVSIDMTQLSKWEDKRSEVTCPKDPEKGPPEFNIQFCKTVWDVDAKKALPVKIRQGCLI